MPPRSKEEPDLLEIAIAGTFAASLEQPMRRHLNIPCNIVVADEENIIPLLGEADVLVTMGFTAAMGRAATRLRLVQVAGAGIDRIDRAALSAGTWLARAVSDQVDA